MRAFRKYVAALLLCLPFSLVGYGGFIDHEGLIILGASLVLPLVIIAAVTYVSSFD